MNVLITGGTGLIGSRVAERLLADGGTAVLLDRFPDAARVDDLQDRYGSRVRVVQGDVLSFANLGDAMREASVDAVVHLAYMLGSESNAQPQTATEVNVTGTVNVLETARLLGVERVVMASSIAVYGGDDEYRPEELPLTEHVAKHVARDLPVYGGGKLYLEKLAQHYRSAYGMLVVGMRPAVVYGWGRRTGATGWMSALVEGPALGSPATVGFGDARVSLVYVDDVAEQFVALLRAERKAFTDTWFFNTGGDTASVREVADLVRELVPDAQIEVTSDGERDLYGLAASLSDEAITQLSGDRRRFSPLRAGLEEYLAVTRRAAER
jgi:UDP-glucose 4-epimerase